MIDKVWLFAVAVGPVLLGLAIVFAIMRRRRLSKTETVTQNEAVRELYDKQTPRV